MCSFRVGQLFQMSHYPGATSVYLVLGGSPPPCPLPLFPCLASSRGKDVTEGSQVADPDEWATEPTSLRRTFKAQHWPPLQRPKHMVLWAEVTGVASRGVVKLVSRPGFQACPRCSLVTMSTADGVFEVQTQKEGTNITHYIVVRYLPFFVSVARAPRFWASFLSQAKGPR